MRRSALRAVVFVAALASTAPFVQARSDAVIPAQGVLEPLFAPWDDIETRLVEVIDGAQRQVLVQAYLLTNKKIAGSLVVAHRRGIDVQILVDARRLADVSSSVVTALSAAGIPVWLETKYQNAHNKVIVVDAASPQAIVVTGSFNFTWTAQHRNAENMLIVRDPALADRYAENWHRHKRDATLYKK